MSDIYVCGKCGGKRPRSGSAVDMLLIAGNSLFNSGDKAGARGNYQNAYNTLNLFSDACGSCLRRIEDRIKECEPKW